MCVCVCVCVCVFMLYSVATSLWRFFYALGLHVFYSIQSVCNQHAENIICWMMDVSNMYNVSMESTAYIKSEGAYLDQVM